MNVIHRVVVIVLILIFILFASGWDKLNGDMVGLRCEFQPALLIDRTAEYIHSDWIEDWGGFHDQTIDGVGTVSFICGSVFYDLTGE